MNKKGESSAVPRERRVVGLDHVGFPQGDIGLYQLLLLNLESSEAHTEIKTRATQSILGNLET